MGCKKTRLTVFFPGHELSEKNADGRAELSLAGFMA